MTAQQAVSAEGLQKHIRTLASDEFEGRLPGTRGERLTLQYLEDACTGLGLLPGGANGSWLQSVPLVSVTTQPGIEFRLSSADYTLEPKHAEEYVAWTTRYTAGVRIQDSELLFVGYGVHAPEYDWDDFKDVDVRGKTLLVLVNDPPIADADHPEQLDPSVFGGKAMTYYGRWTYKLEEAARRGAAGCILIHETEAAGYPWEVVENSWTGELFDLVRANRNMHRCAFEAWITQEVATKVFRLAREDFETAKRMALQPNFQPIPLGIKASVSLQNRLEEFRSHNFIAKLEGSDPQLKSEYVLYTAHWDHLGQDPNLSGDSIYNGAVDNASGTAGILEVARAFCHLPIPPKRSILFMAVTAEEKGLLGSQFYAENPLYPLSGTVAVLNLDGMNVHGYTSDIVQIGIGHSTLDDVAQWAAGFQGRFVAADPTPEKGFFYRSDHFSLMQQGVPALYVKGGTVFPGRTTEWSRQRLADYVRDRYHKPADEFDPSWDLSGMVADVQFMFLAGWQIAEADQRPIWMETSEFAARR